MTRRQSRALRRRFSPKLESLESRQMFAVYYIDSIHGDNDHSGETPDAAFKTVENLVSRYAAPDQPAGYRPLQPGMKSYSCQERMISFTPIAPKGALNFNRSSYETSMAPKNSQL